MTDGPGQGETIHRIATALKRRSGRTWSVTGGHGTAYGWITVTVPPRLRDKYGYMSGADAKTLATLLGLENVHPQGHDVPAASDYRLEAVQRAETGESSVVPHRYWD